MRFRILLILILASAVRLIEIDAPPVGRHAWRQCDTASVARNYHRSDGSFSYPQIDWEIPGYVEMEFPLYPWTVAAAYSWTGESHATARMLAMLGSLLAIGLLYLLVRRILGEPVALWASFFVAVLPLGVFLGRAIMPESWMLASTVAAVLFFLRWTEEENWWLFSLAAAATTLACLLKLTSLYLAIPLLWLAWRRWGRQTLAKWQVWLFAFLVAAPLIAWYGHSFLVGQEYGASFHILTAPGSDKWGNWHLLVDPFFYKRVFLDYLGGRILTWVGLALLMVGLLLPRISARERLFEIWLLSVTAMLLLASGGSYQHDYYSIPLLLPSVAFMGKTMSLAWDRRKKLAAFLLLIILSLSTYRYLGNLAEERESTLDPLIARALALKTRSSDLVVSCNFANPIWFYLADRRGFGRNCDLLTGEQLEELIARGANYLVDRAGSAALSMNEQLIAHVATFYNTLQHGGSVFLADLGQKKTLDTLDWHGLRWLGLQVDDLASYWDMPFGDTPDRSAETRPGRPFPARQVCRMKATLALRNAVTAPRTGKTRLRVWWDHRNQSGLSLTLHPRKRTLRLRQYENGEPVQSENLDYFIQQQRPYALEIRFDLFEFEVWMNRELLLSMPNRQLASPSGGFQLQGQKGALEISDLAVECATAPEPWGRPTSVGR